MTRIAAVASVAHGAAIETVEPVVDRLGHPALDDLGKGLAAERAVALAHSSPSARIAFTTSKAIGRLSIVAVRCVIGVLLFVALA